MLAPLTLPVLLQCRLTAALSAARPLQDITNLKVLKSPPDVVKRIFDCVLLLKYLPIDKVAWMDVKGAMVLCGSFDLSVKMMGDMQASVGGSRQGAHCQDALVRGHTLQEIANHSRASTDVPDRAACGRSEMQQWEGMH